MWPELSYGVLLLQNFYFPIEEILNICIEDFHTGKCFRRFGGIYAYCRTIELDHFQVFSMYMAIYVSN